jgi:hypothetical protein
MVNPDQSSSNASTEHSNMKPSIQDHGSSEQLDPDNERGKIKDATEDGGPGR